MDATKEKKVFVTGQVTKSGVFRARMVIDGKVTCLDIERVQAGFYAVTNHCTGEMTIRQLRVN